ncbi:MAG: choice-of-anchor S family protein [Candidatus Heimdallarchaeota archaeon]
MKTSIAILIICSFLMTQNTLGVFQMTTGDQVAFKIIEASYDIAVETTADAFIGCDNGGTIIAEGTTVVVEIGNITTTNLEWKTIGITPEITGTCPSDIYVTDFLEFALEVYFALISDIDLMEIINTGIIDPVYFDVFELPLFVDPKPQTWIIFDGLEVDIESAVTSIFGSWDSCVVDAVHSEANNVMTMSTSYSATYLMGPDNNYGLNSNNSFSYNMTSGELLEVENHFIIDGVVNTAAFVIDSDYKIEQTDIPVEPTPTGNFLEFLKENKWYFIGGGAGIIVIGATVGIVLGVKKSKASPKKTKKKSTKKKK